MLRHAGFGRGGATPSLVRKRVHLQLLRIWVGRISIGRVVPEVLAETPGEEGGSAHVGGAG
jgi:hypothetical protein